MTATWIVLNTGFDTLWPTLYREFWAQIAIAFLLSFILRTPGNTDDKPLKDWHRVDGWKINPYIV